MVGTNGRWPKGKANFNYIKNRASIVTVDWKMPECIPLRSPYVVIRTLRMACLVFVKWRNVDTRSRR